MANWTRVANGSTAGNISMNVDIGIQSVTRTSNTNVRVVYGVRFAMATSTYTYNSVAAFCPKDSGNRYYAFKSGSGHTSSGTWYYANTDGKTHTGETCPFTIDIPVSITQTSASFSVGYGWNGYTPSQKGSSSITVTFPTGATAPTGLSCSSSNITETTASLSGSYSSDGGASVTATGYQYKIDGGSWTNCTASLTGLTPGKKYYFRYYATNSQGTSYSADTNYFTTYSYPYINSTPNFTIGNVLTIGLYNPLGRTCTVKLIGNNNAELFSDNTSSTTVSGYTSAGHKTALYNSIPNSKTGTYKVRLIYSNKVDKTISGGTYSVIGTEVPNFDASYIIDVVDTLHTDITGNNTKFIKGHNTLTGKIKPMTSSYGANLDYYSISATGQETQTKNYSTSNISFSFNNVTANSFKVNAVDKRGLSKEATKSITIIDYSNPTLTGNTIVRQNGIGDHIIVSFNGKYTNWSGLSQANAIQRFRYRYKAQGTSTWSSWTTITGYVSSNGNWSLTNKLLDNTFNNTKRYDMQIEVQDKLETVVFSGLIVSTANALVWKDLANKRIGVGKKPTKTLDVAGDVEVDGALYVNGVKMIWYE